MLFTIILLVASPVARKKSICCANDLSQGLKSRFWASQSKRISKYVGYVNAKTLTRPALLMDFFSQPPAFFIRWLFFFFKTLLNT